MVQLRAILVVLLAAASARAATLDTLNGAAQGGRDASAAASPSAAKAGASRVWDRPGSGDGGNYVSAPLLPEPAGPTLERFDDGPFVGRPGHRYRISEPKTPLNEDGTAKKQSSGNKLWWALGGAAVGAAAGFMLFGLPGAAVGAAALGLLGFFLGP